MEADDLNREDLELFYEVYLKRLNNQINLKKIECKKKHKN